MLASCYGKLANLVYLARFCCLLCSLHNLCLHLTVVLQHSGYTLIHELLLQSLYTFSIHTSHLATSVSHVRGCPQWRIRFLRCGDWNRTTPAGQVSSVCEQRLDFKISPMTSEDVAQQWKRLNCCGTCRRQKFPLRFPFRSQFSRCLLCTSWHATWSHGVLLNWNIPTFPHNPCNNFQILGKQILCDCNKVDFSGICTRVQVSILLLSILLLWS